MGGGTWCGGGDVAGAVVDMDRASAVSAAGRNSGGGVTVGGAGSSGSWDLRAMEGSHGPGGLRVVTKVDGDGR